MWSRSIIPKQPNDTPGKKPPAPSVKVRMGGKQNLAGLLLSLRIAAPGRFRYGEGGDRIPSMPRFDELIGP